jgi:hypothetical protein
VHLAQPGLGVGRLEVAAGGRTLAQAFQRPSGRQVVLERDTTVTDAGAQPHREVAAAQALRTDRRPTATVAVGSGDNARWVAKARADRPDVTGLQPLLHAGLVGVGELLGVRTAQREAAHAELVGASRRPARISSNEEPTGVREEQVSFSVPLFAQAVLVHHPRHVLDAPVA